MTNTYSGIGSREINIMYATICKQYAITLASLDYTLQSGGASGSDTAFEEGSDLVQGNKKIFLPWKDFNNNTSTLYGVCEKALKIGEYFHPAWYKLSPKAKLLMARNSYQVLGENLDTPVDFIVCYTPNGEEKGGTAQSLRIARHFKIPVFNLGKLNSEGALDNRIESVKLQKLLS